MPRGQSCNESQERTNGTSAHVDDVDPSMPFLLSCFFQHEISIAARIQVFAIAELWVRYMFRSCPYDLEKCFDYENGTVLGNRLQNR